MAEPDPQVAPPASPDPTAPLRVERHDDAFVEHITPRPAPLVAGAGWLLPGLGYWVIGLRSRALFAGATILLLFLVGIFVGGIRVIDVPGYRDQVRMGDYSDLGGHRKVRTPEGRWVLAARPLATVLDKPWYIAQFMAGPVTLISSYFSIEAGQQQHPKATAHVGEFGTLFCAIAGMLNLLIIIDASARSAAAPPTP